MFSHFSLPLYFPSPLHGSVKGVARRRVGKVSYRIGVAYRFLLSVRVSVVIKNLREKEMFWKTATTTTTNNWSSSEQPNQIEHLMMYDTDTFSFQIKASFSTGGKHSLESPSQLLLTQTWEFDIGCICNVLSRCLTLELVGLFSMIKSLHNTKGNMLSLYHISQLK